MRHNGFLLAVALSITTATTTFLTHPATAYPVDCAILLCLSGGWPASAECSHARTVFIERITPWPIEPPLQIWRCPMSVSYDLPSAQPRPERIYDISFSDSPLPQFLQPDGPWAITPPVPPVMRQAAVAGASFDQRQWPGVPDISQVTPQLGQQSPPADIDITGSELKFVRSIRVFNILIDDDRIDGDCERYDPVSVGTYDRNPHTRTRQFLGLARLSDQSARRSPSTGPIEMHRLTIIRMPGGFQRYDLVRAILRLRKAVFIDRMYWPLYQYDTIEFEQYDTFNAVYLIAHDGAQVLGGARLIRTDQVIATGKIKYSYMIRDAYNGHLPRIPAIFASKLRLLIQKYGS